MKKAVVYLRTHATVGHEWGIQLEVSEAPLWRRDRGYTSEKAEGTLDVSGLLWLFLGVRKMADFKDVHSASARAYCQVFSLNVEP